MITAWKEEPDPPPSPATGESPPTRPLTAKQQRFVELYVYSLNASQSYREAGYKCKNGNVANANASLLRASHKVQFAIQQALQARSQRTEITADYVLRKLKQEVEQGDPGSPSAAVIRGLEL